MNEKTVYDYCGTGKMVTQQFWRNAFLAEICDMQIPEGTKVIKLTQEQKNGICADKYTEALAHLLILFGAGYVDYDVISDLSKDSEKYTDIIFDTENHVISQAQENTENQSSEEVVSSVFLCAVNSRRYEEIQEVDFETALRLHGNIRLTICRGYVFTRNNDFLMFLADVGEPIAHFSGTEIGTISAESIRNAFAESDESIEKEAAREYAKYPNTPFLLNIRNAERIAEIYGKPYAAEFVRYAKEKRIPFDKDFSRKYDDFVLKEKLHFVISVISKKRYICGNIDCWFDYGATEYQEDKIALGEKFDKTTELDLNVNTANEPDGETLVEAAIAEYLKNAEKTMPPDTVMEITHGGKKYLYVFRRDGNREALDSDSFHHIPFNYNDLWTIIMEWSRSRKIVKKNNAVQIPVEEWDRIAPKDREYARRLIEEQYARHKEGNVMLQTLSGLKAYAAANADKKEAIKKGQSAVREVVKNKEDEDNENSGS